MTATPRTGLQLLTLNYLADLTRTQCEAHLHYSIHTAGLQATIFILAVSLFHICACLMCF